MYAHRQQGKGLFAFLAGSVVALVAIAGVLFMINNNNTRDFKQPESKNTTPRDNTQPDILNPGGATSVPTAPTGKTADSSPQLPPPTPPEPKTPEITVRQNDIPPTPPEPPKTTQKADTDKIQPPVEPVQPETPPKQQTDTGSKTKTPDTRDDFDESKVQPTAEQILDNGSLEKAQEAAIREARQKHERERAARERQQAQRESARIQQPAAKTDSRQPENRKKTETAAKGKNAGGQVSIQAGAYNNRNAAETQRARLALLGISSQIVPVESNGKTMYRVQTERMGSRHADQVSKTLKDNGINSITRKQ